MNSNSNGNSEKEKHDKHLKTKVKRIDIKL